MFKLHLSSFQLLWMNVACEKNDFIEFMMGQYAFKEVNILHA